MTSLSSRHKQFFFSTSSNDKCILCVQNVKKAKTISSISTVSHTIYIEFFIGKNGIKSCWILKSVYLSIETIHNAEQRETEKNQNKSYGRLEKYSLKDTRNECIEKRRSRLNGQYTHGKYRWREIARQTQHLHYIETKPLANVMFFFKNNKPQQHRSKPAFLCVCKKWWKSLKSTIWLIRRDYAVCTLY